MIPQRTYRGRFAPSPTGPLHAGSLVAALASWLDARAHDGTWLVRIEDVDTPRTVVGAARHILQQLSACGLEPNETPTLQSERTALYQEALLQLSEQRLVYPCQCRTSAAAWRCGGWSERAMVNWSTLEPADRYLTTQQTSCYSPKTQAPLARGGFVPIFV